MSAQDPGFVARSAGDGAVELEMYGCIHTLHRKLARRLFASLQEALGVMPSVEHLPTAKEDDMSIEQDCGVDWMLTVAMHGDVRIDHARARGDAGSDDFEVCVRIGGRPVIETVMHGDEMRDQVGDAVARLLRNRVELGIYTTRFSAVEIMGLRGELAERIATARWSEGLAPDPAGPVLEHSAPQPVATIVAEVSGAAIYSVRSTHPVRVVFLDNEADMADPDDCVANVDGQAVVVRKYDLTSGPDHEGADSVDPTAIAAILATLDRGGETGVSPASLPMPGMG